MDWQLYNQGSVTNLPRQVGLGGYNKVMGFNKPDLYFYWHGDIEEDYDMGDYTCLCEICFDINNSEGKIAWKDDKNPFECTSL